MKSKKSSGKTMNMGQSSMDSNVPKQKSMFPGATKYTGNTSPGSPLKQQSTTSATITRTKASGARVNGHTAKGLVVRSGPKATLKRTTSRGK